MLHNLFLGVLLSVLGRLVGRCFGVLGRVFLALLCRLVGLRVGGLDPLVGLFLDRVLLLLGFF